MDDLIVIAILVAAFVFGGWILALVFGVKHARLRRRIEGREADVRRDWELIEQTRNLPPSLAAADERARRIIVIRLELEAARLAASDIDADQRPELDAQLNALAREFIEEQGFEAGSPTWSRERDAAWAMLEQHAGESLGPAPWMATSDGFTRPLTFAPLPDAIAPAGPQPSMEDTNVAPVTAAGPADSTEHSFDFDFQDEATASATDASEAAGSDAASTAMDRSQDERDAVEIVSPDLTPAAPNALEQALRAFSAWPRALLPFMAQNIGWFIGVFCFLAGSVFLVTYTSGFAKALTVCGVIFAYTLFSTWSGYNLRRKRPNLKTASLVLMTTGVLLVPLNFSAAARLLLVADQSAMLWMTSALIAVVMLATFYVLTRVVSGIVDRMLQGMHPVLFLGLAAAQLLLPVVARWPHWLVLTAIHLALAAVLGFALLRHTRVWIQSILVDRRQVAYFAVGSLVYAFIVSLVHLTWGAGDVALPPGYIAPYLMLLSGALFYLDSHFKSHADRIAWLSRFTFAVYALSALALGLSLEVPLSRLVTMALGAIIYAIVVWRYVTFTPVYPLLVCLGGLYLSLVVLRMPAGWHFLATLPAIVVLHRLSVALGARLGNRALRNRIDLGAFRVMGVLIIAAFAWSMINSQFDLITAASACALAGILWWLLGRAPGLLFGAPTENGQIQDALADDAPDVVNLRDGPWLYTVIGAIGIAAVSFTPLPGLALDAQRAIGLTVVGGILSAMVVVSPAGFISLSLRQIEIVANGALIHAGGAVVLVALLLERAAIAFDLAGIITVAAGAIYWLIALRLRSPMLVYLAFGLAGGAGILLKRAWFPGPSTGSSVLAVATAVWVVLVWLERRPQLSPDTQRPFEELRLLWLLRGRRYRDAADPARDTPVPAEVTSDGSGEVLSRG